jgi:uncharacterized delta-60 repeat protein
MTTQESFNAGQLDPTFGNNGIVTIDLPNGMSRFPSIVTFGTGAALKIYFAGWLVTTTPYTYVVGRLNRDGTPDKAFGNDGLITGLFAGQSAVVRSMAIQPDGKIILFAEQNYGASFPCFARFDSDGTLDKSFGTDGYTVLEIELAPPAPASALDAKAPSSNSGASPFGVEILPDGKILAFKHYTFGGTGGGSIGLIIRLNAEGLLDTDFNQIGYIGVIHPDYLHTATVLSDIMVQADGKYLGCGAVGNYVDPASAMFVRYDTEGNLDTSFGTKGNGFVTIEAPASTEGIGVQRMVQQPNQRILGIGRTDSAMGLMTSIEPDGTPNIQFNRGVPLITSLQDNAVTDWTGGAIQKDGKIVVAGTVGTVNGEADIVVARFIDEKFDPAFNNGMGWVSTHVEDGTESATGVALQDDGKILISAYTDSLGKALVLRYLA